MEEQVHVDGSIPRNTVTIVLDGSAEDVLANYRQAIAHFRQWNRLNGIRVDVSDLFGAQREVYTTPAGGTFYFVVRYRGRSLVFVIQGRSLWLVGFINSNGMYEMISNNQDVHYMNSRHCRWLNFKGNHRCISNSNPGGTRVGLHPLRNAFDTAWVYNGENPEPDGFRSSIGVFVIHLCEVKCQDIFNRVCSAFTDPSINRLASDVEIGYGIELYCQVWSFLSSESMQHIDYRKRAMAAPELNNAGIKLIRTAEDILSTIRILHRDGYNEGVFEHEPNPEPPRFWEPIDAGQGDVDDIMFFHGDDDSDEDSEEDDSDRGRKRWQPKKKKRRRPQQQHKFEARREGTPGGRPTEVPQGLVDRWNGLLLQISKEFFPPIMKLQTVEVLSLVGCAGIHKDTLGCLENECSKSAQVLDITNVTHVGVSSIVKSMPNMLELNLSYCCNRTRKLQTLKLDGCQFMADGLKSIGSYCASLRELSLSKCSGVTDTDLSFIVSRLKNLPKLDITCNRKIADVSFAAITSSCPSLISLRMESYSRVSSEGLQMIGKRCCHLEELDLTDSHLDDEGLKAISGCSKLSSLKIGICMRISDEGLIHIGRSCSQLRDIDLYRSGGISDEEVTQIAQGCQMLDYINLFYCTEITDKSLMSLSKCGKPNTLEIRGCPRVSSAGLSEIAT